MTVRYVVQSVRRRPWETIAAVVAVAVSVAFVGALGSFVARTGSQLTLRAGARVPVDWQVQLAAGSDPSVALKAIQTTKGFVGARLIDYAKVSGLRTVSSNGVRSTGPAYVVSLPSDYAAFAPGEIRRLRGTTSGVLLQQQTASTLAAAPGDSVSVQGSGRSVTVTGVVDLPNAESFFQTVGAAPGSAATAPPDNVLIVPPSLFSALVPGATVIRQLHVRLDHASLSTDPAKAADDVTQRANHFVAATTGGALVGNNLGSSLSAAREDALYARLLVLLLGVPGLVLSAVVTALVVSLRNDRQRRDLSLLRLRGVTPKRAAALLSLTALLDGTLGALTGFGGAVLANRLALGSGAKLSPTWMLAAIIGGIALALATELAPVARLLRADDLARDNSASSSVSTTPLALRLGLDLLLLAASGIVFWLTARGGYRVVVVPEGIPVASVNYAALLGPALAWPGTALLVWRVAAMTVGRRAGQPTVDPNGRMPDLRREVLRRRRRLVARGATGLAVALAVTISAAVFTTTYDRQAHVDNALTVGSDVAVTVAPDDPTSIDPAIANIPNVTAVEKLAHRLVYVGTDLQDLYGIDPTTIGKAAPLQDAFTPGSSVHALLKVLSETPNGVLLSQETLHDYQLHTGDSVKLRLKKGDLGYVQVSFKVVGVVSEFATAPRDSFVLANRSYISQVTQLSTIQTLLIRTNRPSQVAAAIHAPPGALVNDITAPRTAVLSASGLAAGTLSGLSSLTLGFGMLLALASVGLVLIVGANQRRRSLMTLAVLGASGKQRAGFLWTEAWAIVLAGLAGGITIGALIAMQLVKILTGIFDPPPQHPEVPWSYIAVVIASLTATALVATVASSRWAGRVDPARLRDL